jgi:hypothetical protein
MPGGSSPAGNQQPEAFFDRITGMIGSERQDLEKRADDLLKSVENLQGAVDGLSGDLKKWSGRRRWTDPAGQVEAWRSIEERVGDAMAKRLLLAWEQTSRTGAPPDFEDVESSIRRLELIERGEGSAVLQIAREVARQQVDRLAERLSALSDALEPAHGHIAEFAKRMHDGLVEMEQPLERLMRAVSDLLDQSLSACRDRLDQIGALARKLSALSRRAAGIPGLDAQGRRPASVAAETVDRLISELQTAHEEMRRRIVAVAGMEEMKAELAAAKQSVSEWRVKEHDRHAKLLEDHVAGLSELIARYGRRGR